MNDKNYIDYFFWLFSWYKKRDTPCSCSKTVTENKCATLSNHFSVDTEQSNTYEHSINKDVLKLYNTHQYINSFCAFFSVVQYNHQIIQLQKKLSEYKQQIKDISDIVKKYNIIFQSQGIIKQDISSNLVLSQKLDVLLNHIQPQVLPSSSHQNNLEIKEHQDALLLKEKIDKISHDNPILTHHSTHCQTQINNLLNCLQHTSNSSISPSFLSSPSSTSSSLLSCHHYVQSLCLCAQNPNNKNTISSTTVTTT